MGDRGNIAVRQNRKGDGEPRFVYLYSHWGGTELPAVLQAAMKRGKERLSDTQYIARIIFCEMVKGDGADGLTGYGISDRMHDNKHPILVFDPAGTVEVFAPGNELSWNKPKRTYTHEEYMKLDLGDGGWDVLEGVDGYA